MQPSSFGGSSSRLSLTLQSSELAYELALERMKLKIEQEKLQEEAEAAAIKLNLIERSVKEKALAARKYSEYKDYAAFLQQQREYANSLRAQQTLHDKEPGIAPHFHGYPSIPETPAEQRRRNKLQQQRQLKAELEHQLELQRAQKEKAVSQLKQNDKDLIQGWTEAINEQRQKEQLHRRNERETLVKAWRQVELLKEYKENKSMITSPSVENTDGPVNQVAEVVLPRALEPVVKPPVVVDTPEIVSRSQIRKLKALKLKEKIDSEDQQRYNKIHSHSPDHVSMQSGISGLSSNVVDLMKFKKKPDPRRLRGDYEVNQYNQRLQNRIEKRNSSISTIVKHESPPTGLHPSKLREYGRQTLFGR